MRALLQTSLLVLCLLLAACSKGPQLAKLPPGATLLAFGDSLTFGTGVDNPQSYPSVLAGLINHPIENRGIPGNTTADAKERFADALDETKPALILLCLGGNDFLQKKPQEETIANLRAMLDVAKQRGIGVLLIAVPKPDLSLSAPAFYKELAQAYALPLESEALEAILAKGSLKSDPIHPNAKGYAMLAEKIAARLRKAGAV